MSEGEEVRQWNRAAAANLGWGKWEGGGSCTAGMGCDWILNKLESAAEERKILQTHNCAHTHTSTCTQIQAVSSALTPDMFSSLGKFSDDCSIINPFFFHSNWENIGDKLRGKKWSCSPVWMSTENSSNWSASSCGETFPSWWELSLLDWLLPTSRMYTRAHWEWCKIIPAFAQSPTVRSLGDFWELHHHRNTKWG